MGADARLHIWREDKLKEAWPSCDALLDIMRRSPHFLHVYRHELDGTRYVHIYDDGNNAWRQIAQDDEWNTREPMTEAQLMEFLKLREFVRWLKANATVWEVWT